MWQLFNKLIGIAFPKRDSYTTVVQLQEMDMRAAYDPHTYKDIVALSHFHNPSIRACIHEAKFYENIQAYKLLGTLLHMYVQTSPRTYHIVPIPLSRKRKRKRGYNQVTEVVRRVLKNDSRQTLVTNLLIRTRDTTPQTKLSREERALNVANAFGVRDRHAAAIKGAHILLVDDVVTTGATLNEARLALEPHSPASVTCLALAH